MEYPNPTPEEMQKSLLASELSAIKTLIHTNIYPDSGLKPHLDEAMVRHGLVKIRLRFGSNLTDAVTREWAESLVGLDIAEFVE